MSLMTGQQYIDSLDDGRQVYIEGEKVGRVADHPAFKPMVEAMARMYDLQHQPKYETLFSYPDEDGNPVSRVYKLPETVDDLRQRREMTQAVLKEVSPVIDRFGDETVTPLFVLTDNRELLDRYDTQYYQNVQGWLKKLRENNWFMTSGNTDPKGDRSKQPYQQEDLDVYLRVVEEREDGIVLRGAKYETGASYAHVAFVKPTVGQWLPENRDFAVSCIVPMNSPNLRHICRAPLIKNADPALRPLSARFDEIDNLMVFDNVFVPRENIIFSRQPELAAQIRTELHNWAAQGFLVRSLAKAEVLVGTALLLVEQTRLEPLPPVREKISRLMQYRETINAFIMAAEATYETSRTGMAMPNQAIQNAGRVFASTNYFRMVQILRDLAGGTPIMLTDLKNAVHPDIQADVEKYYRINDVSADARMRVLNLAAELTATAFAGRMQGYQMFAESPPMVQAMALYHTFDKQRARACAAALAGVA
ncbi:MAG: 4-hydroxyphenylacetate 3-hydroxylase N-terminal domain-containing protein [Castellaniella sp.]